MPFESGLRSTTIRLLDSLVVLFQVTVGHRLYVYHLRQHAAYVVSSIFGSFSNLRRCDYKPYTITTTVRHDTARDILSQVFLASVLAGLYHVVRRMTRSAA